MGIFNDFAPAYWGAGLPVIPLREREKRPLLDQWSQFGSIMPSEMLREHWLASHPNGNIGLPLGSASGLCVIDIDTEDEVLIQTLLKALPPSPWVRTGKKGMALAYKWSGQRNFKLRGADGGMICEFLGLGNQVVVPPSIHPDTQKPYTANSNLWEIADTCQELDDDIEEKLRGLLGAAGFSLGAGGRSAPLDIVPAGDRDNQMVRHAGYLARIVLGIDKSANLSLAEAIAHMYHWVEGFTVRVSGDSMDPGKGVLKLLEFLIKDLEKGRTLPEGWDAGLPDEWKAHPTIALLADRNTSQRWTPSRARDWLGVKMSEHPDDPDWAEARVEELIGLVAADENFTELNFRNLIPYIITVSGLGLKKSDLMIAFKAARKGGDEAWEDHETIARAVLEDMQRHGEVRFDNGRFWQWSGSCFRSLDEEAIYMQVATNVKGSALVRKHGDYASVVKVLERMCRGRLIEVEENGINFANGFVSEDLHVADHDPKYGATFTLPFEYDRMLADRCPRWFGFLASCWGHENDFEDRMKALQEMFAATLFKIAPRYQRAFLLFGRAETGKTQVLKVLRAMLPPDAVAELGPELWGTQFQLTALIGKAVNICGELPESGMIVGQVFKRVVEGEPCWTEFKGKDGFHFIPACGHWFASNYIPVSRDSTRGFTRRWQILDFNRVVTAAEKVDGLAEIIVAEEREAIAAWALEGLRRLMVQRGYTEPQCHHRRLAQMRRINNSVHAYLEDAAGVRRDAGGELKCRELYDHYVFHMKDVGRGQPVSFERFMQMLEDLDLDVARDLIGDYVVKGLAKAA